MFNILQSIGTTTFSIITFSFPDIFFCESLTIIPVKKKKNPKHTQEMLTYALVSRQGKSLKSSFTEQKERKFISRQILLIF